MLEQCILGKENIYNAEIYMLSGCGGNTKTIHYNTRIIEH